MASPARISVAKSPTYNDPNTPYDESIFFESIKYAQVAPFVKNQMEINQVYKDTIEQILNTPTMDTKAEIKKMALKINEFLEN